MKTKRYAGALVLLLLVHGAARAENFMGDLAGALSRNDVKKAEEIITGAVGQMTAAEKRQAYSFVLNYSRRESALPLLEVLYKNNIHAAPYDLYAAIDRLHHDGVIEFLLNDGAAPNGEILLLAAEKGRFNWVRRFVELGAATDYKYPGDKPYADGMTALLHASRGNSLETVKLLVEHGADIEARAKDGSTAASIARANNFPDIYRYLLERGAPDSPANVPVPAARNETAADGQGGIAGVIENNKTLKMGTYRLAGAATEIRFIGANSSGNILYKNSQGIMGTGYFQMEGGLLTILLGNTPYHYQIDTGTSFSGSGEKWSRTGD
jgi:hypothetical protein